MLYNLRPLGGLKQIEHVFAHSLMDRYVLFRASVSQSALPIQRLGTRREHDGVRLAERSRPLHELLGSFLAAIASTVAHIKVAASLARVERHVIAVLAAAVIIVFFFLLYARFYLPCHIDILHLFNVDVLGALFTGAALDALRGRLVTVEALHAQAKARDLFQGG